jgi:hypothetical protein
VIRNKLTAVGCLFLLGALWFVAVDESWFVSDCPDCGYGNDVTQYRVFSFPVHESVREAHTIVQQVATDLGVPCKHLKEKSWHKQRWWGLWICTSPCINGTYRLSGDDSWYNHGDSDKVAALAAKDPAIATEFSRRVLEQHEFTFVRTVLDKADVRQR